MDSLRIPYRESVYRNMDERAITLEERKTLLSSWIVCITSVYLITYQEKGNLKGVCCYCPFKFS